MWTVSTPATAGTVPGHGPTELESNVSKPNAPMCVVYGLTLDGESYRYVGRTSCGLAKRMREHVYAARTGKDLPVYRWMRKHGAENVRAVILAEGVREDLPPLESQWVAKLRDEGHHLLNCSDGGEGLINPPAYVTAARVAANKRRFADPAERARISAILSAATRGKPPWNAGQPHPDATREAIRKSLAGRKPPAAAAARARIAHLGNTYGLGTKRTPEQRGRMSAASQEVWEANPARRVEQSLAGKRAMHTRWHVNRGMTKDGCTFCAEPDVIV